MKNLDQLETRRLSHIHFLSKLMAENLRLGWGLIYLITSLACDIAN